MEGKVISIIDSSTIAVIVKRKIKHERFGKVLEREKKFLVHVGDKMPNVNDVVEIASSKPISKMKKWILK